MENNNGNIGNYDIEYSAAWLYKTACEKFPEVEHVWFRWSEFAETNMNILDESLSSISCKLKDACLNYNGSANLWLRWAKLEEKNGNIGNYDIDYSAAWIYNTACEKFSEVDNVWWHWSNLAEVYANVLGETLPSISNKLRDACLNHSVASTVWLKWA